MAPVLSDVTVEWIFPETTEVLISPVSSSSLFPGERLVGYGIVCDASLYISNPRSVSIQETPGVPGGPEPLAYKSSIAVIMVRGTLELIKTEFAVEAKVARPWAFHHRDAIGVEPPVSAWGPQEPLLQVLLGNFFNMWS